MAAKKNKEKKKKKNMKRILSESQQELKVEIIRAKNVSKHNKRNIFKWRNLQSKFH